MQLTFLKLARLCKDRAAELRKKNEAQRENQEVRERSEGRKEGRSAG